MPFVDRLRQPGAGLQNDLGVLTELAHQCLKFLAVYGSLSSKDAHHAGQSAGDGWLDAWLHADDGQRVALAQLLDGSSSRCVASDDNGLALALDKEIAEVSGALLQQSDGLVAIGRPGQIGDVEEVFVGQLSA